MKKKNKIKKIFKNLFIFSLMCVFSSCEFFTDSFNAPVKDFFRDNTEAASIGLFEFSSETYKNPITKKLTVSSLQDANVVLYLRNPQEYNFITSENMTSTFGSFLQSEYSLVQDENDKNILNLTIPKELLEKTEIESRNNEYNKSQNILINLFHPVSKAEFVSFALEFDCDTVPPKILSPVFYNTNSSYKDTSKRKNYVIAFNMPKKSEVCSLGVHNDLEKLLIDETEYKVSIADDGTIKFPNNSGIIAGDVNTIEGIEPKNIKFVTQDDYQPFYIVTDTQISIEGAKATLSLVDKGNFSSKINISSNSRMLGKVSLKANDTVFTSETGVIEVNQEENESYANITIIPPSVSVDLDGNEEDVLDVFVKYTIKNLITGEIFDSGSNNGKDSVQIKIPSGKYSIECVAQKDYFADSVTTFESIQINGSLFNFYVAASGDDSYSGILSAPVKTIQKAVDKVIAMNEVTASSEGNPYKILLLSDIISDDSFESNNNALVNINPSSGNPLYLEISKYGDGNATINANRIDSNTGRVMYIGEKANVTLKNLTLKGGYILSENGGGIYSKGNCKLNSCTILGNTAKARNSSVRGGGVYIESGSFTMEDCTISGNTAGSETSDAYAYANAYGGGIFGESGTNITMNDTTISENKVASVNGVEGAGVCLHGANLTMNGGLISENVCSSDSSSFGGGVYVSDGTFSMEGDAVVDSSNDVYLKTGKTITISGELTFNGYVATITPENYAKNYEGNYEEVQVLAAGTDITLNDQLVGKFNVTKYNNNNVETKITETGFLKNTLTLGENPELTEDLYNICSTINVTSADGMKELSQLTGKTFDGKTIILKNDVVLDENYEPIHTFSGVFDGGDGHSIEITAPQIYKWDSPKGKALFYIVQGENAEIKNLKVTGTAEGAGIAYNLTNKAKISNCKSEVNITTKGNNYPTPGGIVSNLKNGGIIENCENYGTIICNEKNTGGGIVGDMASSDENDCREYPVIANCTNYGNVTINDVTGVVKMGGICGDFNFGTIFNCANKGEVTVTTENNCIQILGGIVGFCCGEKIDGIINCYNSGKIYSSSSNSDDQNIGGIVGKGYVGLYNYNHVYYKIRVTNTVNNDDVTFSIGNIHYYDDSEPDITNNFYKKNDRSPISSSYERSFANSIDTVINTLNAYSNTNGYLIWCKDSDGNIIFSKKNSDNQGSTP